ncbi:MAG: fluoride efflux transporter CrcB [Hyphomicrobiales bacterium]|nr:fluoride efflux transporter CrcB [Hyphomicrobiales bacterium]MCP5373934.1 fluoride efflux transporter CrcB [Hyphomicrobiales bacterium]
MSAKMLISVAAGGALGATARFLAMSAIGHFAGSGFPYATLAVNVVGSFVLGGLLEFMALVWSPVEAVRAFMVVGIMGAFTTFSTFSMDVYYLVERGQVVATAAYIVASVTVSIVAFVVGLHMMRLVLA